MARKVSTDVPQLAVPRTTLDRLGADPNAGVDLAVELLTDVRDSKAFDGVHLIPLATLLAAGHLTVDIGWQGSWNDIDQAADAMLGRTLRGKAVFEIN